MSRGPSWVRDEREAQRRYRAALRHSRRAHRAVHALVEMTLSAFRQEKRDPAFVVQATILNQLSNHVRVVMIASERGYPLQALGSLATVYELSAAIGFIGTDLQRARAWQSHTSTRSSYPSSRERRVAMRSLLQAGPVPTERLEADTSAWEQRYEFYCMAKHGNPIVPRRYGLTRQSDTVTLHHGPVGGPGYYALAQVATVRAVELLLMTISVLVKPHLGGLPVKSAKALARRFHGTALRLIEARSQLPTLGGAA